MKMASLGQLRAEKLPYQWPNAEEMRRLYVRDGDVWTVINAPPGPAMEPR